MDAALVRQTFDDNAGEFDQWFGKNRKIYLSELNALRAAHPQGLTLDIGVGSGIFASKLGTFLGIDVSRNLLELSRKRRLRVVQADATHIPARDRSFDSVVISFTICFVDDARAMLCEAFRVLKDDGRLLLGEIALDSEWGQLYAREGRKGHPFYSKARFLTLRDTRSLLSEAGFKIEGAFGTVEFGPSEKPKVEEATPIDLGNPSEAARYGFVCLTALKDGR